MMPRAWWALLLLGLGIGLRAGPGWWPETAAATATPRPAPTATVTPGRPAPIGITSPGFGAVLRGTVIIHGRPRAPHAVRAALELGYSPAGPWFVLVQWTPPPEPGPLWAWDTTTVADGAYWLRLRVTLDDGSSLEYVLPVQVRNYSAPEPTPTSAAHPGPPPVRATATPSPTPWPTPAPRPRAPANPAGLGWEVWQRSAQAALGLTLAAVLLFILRARRR